MAIKLSEIVKHEMLDKSFSFSRDTYYLSIPNIIGAPGGETMPNQVVRFNKASISKVELATPVQFAVQAGTLVNMIYISTQPINGASPASNFDTITLQGDEIGDFATGAGIYLVNSIIINLKEGI